MPPQIASDPYIDRLKAARERPAVLKVRLAALRSKLPNCLVFAFEGDTDKPVYYQWIRQLRPTLNYEPFPCSGKAQVLEFREMLMRDVNGLRNGVYYFIDRDFDDYRGHLAAPETTFMTDRYSVENYLVSSSVLERLLIDDFHCNAQPDIRKANIDKFKLRFTEFLEATTAANFRIFIARRLGIKLKNGLPDKIRTLVDVSLERVSATGTPVEEIILLVEEPTDHQKTALETEFKTLNKEDRFRGKFHFMFFMKYLDLLCQERRLEESKQFPQLAPRTISTQTMTLGMLASKSEYPRGLANFLNSIQ